ncbi:alpha/beta hydrolase [Algirhabdus cladophorae]|uniref:alpha/beta hydrolase n=1 Tax=Algirhabdus cladophorae TaxID=3377108 RepID=UPI003B84B72F
MTLLHLDAVGTQPKMADGTDVATAFAALPSGSSTIIVLLHGFRYAPTAPHNSPHSTLYSLTPNSRLARANVSWVGGLGIEAEATNGNLCIGFGWNARGTIWRANAQAQSAAIALRTTLRLLRARFAHRPIAILAHSLGARVALESLEGLSADTVARMVLMSPAVMQQHAQTALKTPAGRSTEVINIISRQNDLYDAALEWMLHPRDVQAKALGDGLGHAQNNWLDIEIDHPQVSRALMQIGHPLGPAPATVCHWSCYTRDGIFDLYKAMLCKPRETPLPYLRRHLGQPATPRWSRLINPDLRRMLLPFALKS